MANLFFTPNRMITGEGALTFSKPYLSDHGKRALIVTDDMMVKLGNVAKLTAVLEDISMSYVIYSGINSEPDDNMIDSGATIYQENGCDCLIAIGGGSSIDSMKAIGAVVTSGGSIDDYIGKQIQKPLPPTCAIPTTAGTGSEATQFTIINNTKENIKMLLTSPVLISQLAIIDPVFTMTAPPSITASTGIDALCHAVEAYTSKKAFPMADTMAVSAIKRVFNSLYTCFTDGSNMEARADMATAALEAGIAFNNSSVTLVHGMSRPIGALYHVPHGLSNAMLMDKCLHFAAQGCPNRFCTLSKEIGVYQKGMTDDEGAEAFLQAMSDLIHQMHIKSPKEFGIDKEDFFKNVDKMATDAINSGSPANTRRTPTKEEIIKLYHSLYEN